VHAHSTAGRESFFVAEVGAAAAGTIFSFAAAVLNAWVLLVEIQR